MILIAVDCGRDHPQRFSARLSRRSYRVLPQSGEIRSKAEQLQHSIPDHLSSEYVKDSNKEFLLSFDIIFLLQICLRSNISQLPGVLSLPTRSINSKHTLLYVPSLTTTVHLFTDHLCASCAIQKRIMPFIVKDFRQRVVGLAFHAFRYTVKTILKSSGSILIL